MGWMGLMGLMGLMGDNRKPIKPIHPIRPIPPINPTKPIHPMKRNLIFMLLCMALSAAAQTKFVYTEAAELTMTGQFFRDNPNPYHRVDTARFHGFTSGENFQVRMSTGMACAFRTNSAAIRVKAEYGQTSSLLNLTDIAVRGFDLYIRCDGRWLWAASGVNPDKDLGRELTLISDMDGSEHECLLYMPIFSELRSVKVGVTEGSTLEPLEAPFSHRIVFFGSSFTHGASTSRPGMGYPMQLGRWTELQFINLGCSGNCKLQPYFCDVLCATQADAFIFDTFSNPSIKEIETRLFPFIEQLQQSHPGKPLIFQRTIWRERRNFNTAAERSERLRQERVDELMAEACRRYKDVYYIRTTNATSDLHETSVDGVHPDDYGHTLWAESLRKPVLKILKKYGIRP